MMKKSRLFLALLFVSLSFVLLPTAARAAMWDVPVGPGESFRWVFVTSVGIEGGSAQIAVYNDFVNQVADDAPYTPITNIVGVTNLAEISWAAIASTFFTDAIDNIGESSSGIFTPRGDLVANGTSDMFDGGINFPILFTEKGAPTLEYWVWTGTDSDGRVRETEPWTALGYTQPMTGYVPYSPAPETWIARVHGWSYTNKFPIYSISEELTVVPVPGALILAATGMFSAALGLKRLRRKR